MTLHIGRDALNLANRSNQDWMGELRLGMLPGFRMASTVRVRTLAQADLNYSLFQGVDGQVTAEAAARAAREQTTVRCTDRPVEHTTGGSEPVGVTVPSGQAPTTPAPHASGLVRTFRRQAWPRSERR